MTNRTKMAEQKRVFAARLLSAGRTRAYTLRAVKTKFGSGIASRDLTKASKAKLSALNDPFERPLTATELKAAAEHVPQKESEQRKSSQSLASRSGTWVPPGRQEQQPSASSDFMLSVEIGPYLHGVAAKLASENVTRLVMEKVDGKWRYEVTRVYGGPIL